MERGLGPEARGAGMAQPERWGGGCPIKGEGPGEAASGPSGAPPRGPPPGRAPADSSPSQRFPSTPFTAPASSRSRVCARVWRFCCSPSGSSESPPCPGGPLTPDFGNPSTPSCWNRSRAFSPVRLPLDCARHRTGRSARVLSFHLSTLLLRRRYGSAQAQRGSVTDPRSHRCK